MKIKCITGKLNDKQLYVLGKNPVAKNHYSITLGKEYTVFGLTFEFSGNSGCFAQIISDYEHLIHVPLLLFEVVDKRPSELWEFKQFNNGDIGMWPSSFYQEFYHDDLFEGVTEVLEDFQLIKQFILNEFK